MACLLRFEFSRQPGTQQQSRGDFFPLYLRGISLMPNRQRNVGFVGLLTENKRPICLPSAGQRPHDAQRLTMQNQLAIEPDRENDVTCIQTLTDSLPIRSADAIR